MKPLNQQIIDMINAHPDSMIYLDCRDGGEAEGVDYEEEVDSIMIWSDK